MVKGMAGTFTFMVLQGTAYLQELCFQGLDLHLGQGYMGLVDGKLTLFWLIHGWKRLSLPVISL